VPFDFLGFFLNNRVESLRLVMSLHVCSTVVMDIGNTERFNGDAEKQQWMR
jgi:hypothetical protein